MMENGDKHNTDPSSGFVGKMVLCFFIVSISYFLVMEHWAHLVPYLPYFILVLCPLMHFFHHREHREPNNHEEGKLDQQEE